MNDKKIIEIGLYDISISRSLLSPRLQAEVDYSFRDLHNSYHTQPHSAIDKKHILCSLKELKYGNNCFYQNLTSIRGTLRLFSVKYLFGEANIA